jgi:hypothetical protein
MSSLTTVQVQSECKINGEDLRSLTQKTTNRGTTIIFPEGLENTTFPKFETYHTCGES